MTKEKIEVYVLFGIYDWGDKVILMINANEDSTYALKELYQENGYGNFTGYEIQKHDFIK